MSKKRVYELAKELDLSSKNIVDKAHSMGIDVKNHMSTLSESDISKLKSEMVKKNTSSNENIKAKQVVKKENNHCSTFKS